MLLQVFKTLKEVKTMIYSSTFIPNIENSSNFEEFDYLFGCKCNQENNYCSIDGSKECPITLQ